MSSPSNSLTAGHALATSGKRAKNLVIVHAGNSSLHPGWLAGPGDRNWDIIVNYSGDDPNLYRGDDIVRIDSQGPKWPALYDLFQEHRAEILQYDYIWLPDDDLATDKNTINRMFDFCAELKLELAQPALSHDSYYSRLITMQNLQFKVRYTNFVEIAAPVFSRAFLPPCADSFKESPDGSGLDLLWPAWLGGNDKAAIIDECVVRRTHVLEDPNHQAISATRKIPLKESSEVVAKFGITNTTHKIAGGIDRRGCRISFAGGKGDELIERVIAGYLTQLVKETGAILSLLPPMFHELTSAPTGTSAVKRYRAEIEQRAQIALRTGAELVQAGNPAQAVKVLGLSLAENETCELWNDWATAQCACGDRVRAEWGYRCALRLDPLNRDAAVNLGLLLLTQGRSNDALPLLTTHSDSLSKLEMQAFQQLTMQSQSQQPVPQEALLPAKSALPGKAEASGEKVTNDLVVARYQEDLEWIAGVPEDFDIVIYNKGTPITSPAVITRAKLIIDKPNVGRESETYLAHMLQMREAHANPALFTVFCQGDPFEHSPDFLELLKDWREWEKIQPLTWCWSEAGSIPPANFLELHQIRFGTSLRVRPELYSLHTMYPIDYWYAGGIGLRYRKQHALPEGTNLVSHFLHLCGFDDLAGKAAEHLVGRVTLAAIFAARNDVVLSLPLAGLKQAHQLAQGLEIYGYMFERTWLHLLGEDFLLPCTLRHVKTRAVSSATGAMPEPPLPSLSAGQTVAGQGDGPDMGNLPAHVPGNQEAARNGTTQVA